MKTTTSISTKQNSKAQLLVLLVITFLSQNNNAQSWQWLQAGGNNDSGSGPDYTQRMKYMDSDSQGNVYLATNQLGTGIGFISTPFTISNYQVPHYGGFDSILASIGCDGLLRWTVAIGGDYTPAAIGGCLNCHAAEIFSLKTDAQGNVYITGKITRVGHNPSQPFHFSPTYTVPTSPANNLHQEQFYIAKYNTNGELQWVRFPEGADVVLNEAPGRGYAITMDVDPNGTIHVYALFYPGVFCNGALTITGAPLSLTRRILKYDTNGNYIGNAAIDYYSVDDGYWPFTFLHDPNLDRYYMSKAIYYPQAPIIIGGQVQTKAFYVAAFDSNGAFLWKKEDNNPNLNGSFNGLYNCLSLDEASNLYLDCTLAALYNSDDVQIGINSWNGQLITPPIDEAGSIIQASVVVKMDSNGNTVWMKNNTNVVSGSAVNKSVVNGNELAISLGFKGFGWEGIPDIFSNVNGSSPGILRLNKDTGVGISLDYLNVGSPSTFAASAIAAGPNGSYYLGGGFETTISINPSGSPQTINTGGFDDFFIAKFGTNNCSLTTTATSIKDAIQTYPNPVASLLYITNKEEVSYIIYDGLGKMVQMDTLAPNGNIDLQYLNNGIYLIQMKDEKGNVTTKKIMKE